MLSNYLPKLLADSDKPERLSYHLKEVSLNPRALAEARKIFDLLLPLFGAPVVPVAVAPVMPPPDQKVVGFPVNPYEVKSNILSREVESLKAANASLTKALAERGEVTSPEVAKDAAKLLNDPKSSAVVKRVAASALTQVSKK